MCQQFLPACFFFPPLKEVVPTPDSSSLFFLSFPPDYAPFPAGNLEYMSNVGFFFSLSFPPRDLFSLMRERRAPPLPLFPFSEDYRLLNGTPVPLLRAPFSLPSLDPPSSFAICKTPQTSIRGPIFFSFGESLPDFSRISHDQSYSPSLLCFFREIPFIIGILATSCLRSNHPLGVGFSRITNLGFFPLLLLAHGNCWLPATFFVPPRPRNLSLSLPLLSPEHLIRNPPPLSYCYFPVSVSPPPLLISGNSRLLFFFFPAVHRVLPSFFPSRFSRATRSVPFILCLGVAASAPFIFSFPFSSSQIERFFAFPCSQ